MMELHIPHQDPIRFAKYTLFCDAKEALVQLGFAEIPTLAMLVEAAAQASGAFADADTKMGFLVSLKSCELLETPQKLEYKAKLHHQYAMGSMHAYDFEILDTQHKIAQGSFVLAVEK